MRIVSNAGSDRVLDILNAAIDQNSRLSIASPEFSLYAFDELRSWLRSVTGARFILPPVGMEGLGLLRFWSRRRWSWIRLRLRSLHSAIDAATG